MDRFKGFKPWSGKKPAGPVDGSFRQSTDRNHRQDSPPGGFPRANSSDTTCYPVDSQGAKSRLSAIYPPHSQDGLYPDLPVALEISKRPEYLAPGQQSTDPRWQDLGPTGTQPGESNLVDPRMAVPTRQLSRSPERRPAKSKQKHPSRGNEVDDLRYENKDLRSDNKQLNREIGKLETEHKKTLEVKEDRHNREIQKLKDEHKTAIKFHYEELETLKKVANGQAADMRGLRQDLEATKSKANTDRRRMEQDHETKRSNLARDLHNAKAEASQREQRAAQQHADAMKNLNQKIQADRNAAEVNEQRVAQEHTKAITDLKQTHILALSKQQQDHLQRIQHLQLELEELNEAWLNRDDEMYQAMLFTTSGLPRNPDDKITSQILALQQLIDDLSRTPWKPSPELWTDLIFQRIGNQYGQRPLKKAIIQDLIWSLLFQRIFCSPYRMFGEEGKILEHDWNEQCGKERSSGDELYAWPSPGVKTERWRYMTVKECREILSKPIPSHLDKRAEVKRGFKMSQDQLLAALEDELGRVLQLTEQETQLMEKLAKKAAVTWLDFAMHRCRIVIRPMGSATKSTAEKVATLQRGSLALTVLPMVGRYGNVKGVELDRFTTMKGYEGSALNIA